MHFSIWKIEETMKMLISVVLRRWRSETRRFSLIKQVNANRVSTLKGSFSVTAPPSLQCRRQSQLIHWPEIVSLAQYQVWFAVQRWPNISKLTLTAVALQAAFMPILSQSFKQVPISDGKITSAARVLSLSFHYHFSAFRGWKITWKL